MSNKAVRSLTHVVALLAAVIVFPATAEFGSLGAQTTAGAAISGSVQDATSGTPIASAFVQLKVVDSSGRTSRRDVALTDSRGRFVFTALSTGSYTIEASANAFVDGAWGRSTPDSNAARRIQLLDHEWMSAADIRLWRTGSLNGTVTDERGEPAAAVMVVALVRVWAGGLPHWAFTPQTLTDERGRYRIAGLRPDRYVVMVPSPQRATPKNGGAWDLFGADGLSRRPSLDLEGMRLSLGTFPIPPPPAGDRSWAYPITFTDGATAIDTARAVPVGPGEEIAGADVRLAPVRGFSVRGVLDGPANDVSGRLVRLLEPGLEEAPLGGESATAVTQSDGTFQFVNVPAGAYSLDVPLAVGGYEVQTYQQGNDWLAGILADREPNGWARGNGHTDVAGLAMDDTSRSVGTFLGAASVSVGANTSFLIVPRIPDAALNGRVALDPRHDGDTPSNRMLQLDRAGGENRLGALSTAVRVVRDQFSVTNLAPAKYFLRRAGVSDDGWVVESVTSNGKDVSRSGIDLGAGDEGAVIVTLTNRTPTLAGTVRDTVGRPAASSAVIAFSADPQEWRGYALTPDRIQTTLTSESGGYEFRTLPAGSYFLVAVSAEQREAWRDPAFLERAANGAERVSIEWNGATTRDLALSKPRER